MGFMKVTVCQLADEPQALEEGWRGLVEHVGREGSQFVLLPEMPFSPWLARKPAFEPGAWQAAVEDHERWLPRLGELAPAAVLASRPVNRGGRRINQGFVFDAQNGCRPAHEKYYLPNDEGFWEASWYERGNGEFQPLHVGAAYTGFVICTELWFLERARAYGRQGIHLLVCPRATLGETSEKWLAGGRAAAVVSGAYCLSSNRVSQPGSWPVFGGQGWVIDPDGTVLGLTTSEQPYLTIEIELEAAERAKGTYPRYVQE